MRLFYVFKRACGDKIESRGGENRPEKIATDGPGPEVCFFWPGAAVNSGGAGGKCVILHKDTPKIYHICMRTETPVGTFRYGFIGFNTRTFVSSSALC